MESINELYYLLLCFAYGIASSIVYTIINLKIKKVKCLFGIFTFIFIALGLIRLMDKYSFEMNLYLLLFFLLGMLFSRYKYNDDISNNLNIILIYLKKIHRKCQRIRHKINSLFKKIKPKKKNKPIKN